MRCECAHCEARRKPRRASIPSLRPWMGGRFYRARHSFVHTLLDGRLYRARFSSVHTPLDRRSLFALQYGIVRRRRRRRRPRPLSGPIHRALPASARVCACESVRRLREVRRPLGGHHEPPGPPKQCVGVCVCLATQCVCVPCPLEIVIYNPWTLTV